MKTLEFYEILRELREMKEPKVTQKELAHILITAQSKISRLETGEAEPSLEDLRLLCQYYEVSADYLIGISEMPHPKKD